MNNLSERASSGTPIVIADRPEKNDESHIGRLLSEGNRSGPGHSIWLRQLALTVTAHDYLAPRGGSGTGGAVKFARKTNPR